MKFSLEGFDNIRERFATWNECLIDLGWIEGSHIVVLLAQCHEMFPLD